MGSKKQLIGVIFGILIVAIIGIISVKFIMNRLPKPDNNGEYPTGNDLPTSGTMPSDQTENTMPDSTQTAPPSSSQDSSQAKEEAASQIRDLNKAMDEYNNYNNAANQLNSSNTSL